MPPSWPRGLRTGQGVPVLCGDLLGEDAELLPHPQDNGCPRARGEVTEGQEAARGCGEGERAQSSPGTSQPRLGREDGHTGG